MPAADPPSEAAADEPSLSVPVLAWAVATEEMPQVMQDRLDASPAVFTLAEVRALDASEKAEILAVVEKAIVHFENQAEAYRAQGNTAQHTADELSAFLEAARD
mgnify:CR=1 FL=1